MGHRLYVDPLFALREMYECDDAEAGDAIKGKTSGLFGAQWHPITRRQFEWNP